MADLGALSQALIVGDLGACVKLTRQAVEEGVDLLVIFQRALIPGMDIVGRKMQARDYYLPEVLLSARVMKGAAEILRPLPAENLPAELAGRVVLGMVGGDPHNTGKNLVGMMLEGVRFEVTDLRTNVSPERFVAAVQEEGTGIVGHRCC